MADNDFVVKNGLIVNTNVLVVDGATNKVGVNTATPDAAFTVVGTANVSGNVTLSANLYVAGNTTINGRFEVTNNAYVDKKLYVGNTDTMIQDLPTIIQAVDNFNGFVMISSQNLSKLDDACADLITYADNTNGLSHFNDIGINNSRFDGTIHRIIANSTANTWQLNETVFQKNGAGANIAVGVIRDIVSINATAVSLKISVSEDDGLQTYVGISDFVPTVGANLAIRGVTSAANADILFAVPFFSPLANTLSRRNYGFTIGKRGDGYLYNANSALTIGTTAGGLRTTEYSLSLSTFSSGQTSIVLSSGNTDLLYADMIINGTGIPADAYIRSITNSTAFVMSKPTTTGSSGTYIARDPYYDATGNPIIFHINGMMAKDEIARFTGNGNFTIGSNTTARNSKLTVAGTANITGNVTFGEDITVAGRINGIVNATGLSFGSNVDISSSGIRVGNTTANMFANSILVRVANSTTAANLTPAGLWIGNTGSNVSINSSVFTGTANNTFFVGSVSTANVVSNAQLIANLSNYQLAAGNAALSNFTTTSSPSANLVTVGAANVSFDTNVLFVDSVNNRIGVKTTTPDTQLNVIGSANISQDLWIGGNFIVGGSVTTTGVFQATGDINPDSNNYNLGNSTKLWNLTGNNILVSNIGTSTFTATTSVKVGANVVANLTSIKVGDVSHYSLLTNAAIDTTGVLTVGGTSTLHNLVIHDDTISVGNVAIGSNVKVVVSGTNIKFGNSVTNSTINSTAFSGTANNSTYLNGQFASYYVNPVNLIGTIPADKLPTGNATHIGGLQIVDSVTNTSITITASANNVKDAYDRAIAANTRAASAQTAAISAYSNGVTYADGKAATAYSNAVSYADGKAATAYSNGVTYADGKAATAYSNAVSYVTARIINSINDTRIDYAGSVGSVKTAYDSAIAANNRATSAQTAAVAAYSNAVAYADSKVVGSATTTYVDGKAATAYSNAISTILGYSYVTPTNLSNNLANYVTTSSFGTSVNTGTVGIGTGGITSGWSVKNVSGSLVFAYAGVNKMKLTTAGNLIVTGDVTAFGTV